mmetsp:Transcript_109836/g.317563  ORF Transcript_109836/g.317563 Transcript_109836/m.317563 type:complete len:80 (+) Transcript_109836:317-556(+)
MGTFETCRESIEDVVQSLPLSSSDPLLRSWVDATDVDFGMLSRRGALFSSPAVEVFAKLCSLLLFPPLSMGREKFMLSS